MEVAEKILTNAKMPFCPGCGHGVCVRSISKSLDDLDKLLNITEKLPKNWYYGCWMYDKKLPVRDSNTPYHEFGRTWNGATWNYGSVERLHF